MGSGKNGSLTPATITIVYPAVYICGVSLHNPFSTFPSMFFLLNSFLSKHTHVMEGKESLHNQQISLYYLTTYRLETLHYIDSTTHKLKRKYFHQLYVFLHWISLSQNKPSPLSQYIHFK